MDALKGPDFKLTVASDADKIAAALHRIALALEKLSMVVDRQRQGDVGH